MNARRFVSDCCSLLAGTGLLLGASFAQAQESSTIRIGSLGIADNVPVLIADKLGYFKDEGISVTVTTFAGGAAALPALFAGKIDIVHSNVISVLLARAQGYDVTIVSNNSVSRSSVPDAAQLLVKKDAPFKNPKDLEGKRVAVNTFNSPVHLSIRAVVDKHGGDAKKVNFIEIPFPQMIDALLNDRVDAIGEVEPFSTIAGGTGRTRVLAYYYNEVQPGVEIAEMVALESWVKANPNNTRKFVRAFGRGIAQMTKSPEDMKKALLEYTKLSPELADKVVMNVLTTRSDPKSIEVWETLMLKYGLLKQRVGVQSIISPSALE